MLAAVMHLTRGRTMRDLAVIWLAVSVGFWLTAIAAAWLRAPLYAIGELQLIAGLVGGLVAALRPALETRGGAWVGWDGGAEDMPRRVGGLEIALAPVSLSRREVADCYHGFSNRTPWPLFARRDRAAGLRARLVADLCGRQRAIRRRRDRPARAAVGARPS